MSGELTFIQVGDLAKGISENLLPDSTALTAKILQLHWEDGGISRIQFSSARTLTWEVLEGADKGQKGQESYRATCPRENIFLVDYVQQSLRATSVSLIIDLKAHIATAVIGTLPSESQTRIDAFSRVTQNLELTGVSVQFLRAAVDLPFAAHSHGHMPTRDLIGKRIQYVYSRTEEYEHIYLNENLYTWHCLKGTEKGLADTDRCHYRKIADALYLFVWREKVIPTLGVVLVDLDQMKTTGKLFGYEGDDFGRLTNAPLGAYATLWNITEYHHSEHEPGTVTP